MTFEQIEKIAKVAHEANRAYCQGLGDNSQPSWDEAPVWQRDSERHGVQAVLDNPVMGPEASHESWMKEKVAEGWVYGETKDPVKKTHPCIQPYHKLPKEQRGKDHLFLAIVRSLIYVDRHE